GRPVYQPGPSPLPETQALRALVGQAQDRAREQAVGGDQHAQRDSSGSREPGPDGQRRAAPGLLDRVLQIKDANRADGGDEAQGRPDQADGEQLEVPALRQRGTDRELSEEAREWRRTRERQQSDGDGGGAMWPQRAQSSQRG